MNFMAACFQSCVSGYNSNTRFSNTYITITLWIAITGDEEHLSSHGDVLVCMCVSIKGVGREAEI